MKSIFVFPDKVKNNQYIDIHKRIWSSLGFIVKPVKAMSVTDILSRNSNIAILNWMEDGVLTSTGCVAYSKFIRKIIILLYVKLICHKVVWVKHNVRPHSQSSASFSILYKMFLWVYGKLSTSIVTHAEDKTQCSIVIPHPLYPTTRSNHDIELDGHNHRFAVIGVISRYKNIDGLLNAWPKDIPLYIVGACKDVSYLAQLETIISERNISVTIDNRFLLDQELDQILSETDTVIIPHHPGTMIVSGAFYHAVSHGCNVLMAQSDFYLNVCKKFKFVSSYKDSDELLLQLHQQQLVPKMNVMAEVQLACGDSVVSQHWNNLLGGSR